MRGILGLLLLTPLLLGAAPTRDNTYIAGTPILPQDVMANENTIYTYLQNGVDTYAAGSVNTAALANNAVTTTKILNGTILAEDLAFSVSGNALPSGSVFFMLTGSCPSWTTDVSSTYANLFLRVNATAGTLGGGDTHEHSAGTYAGSAHTHSIPNSIGDNSGGATDTGGGQQYSLDDHTHGGATGSGGGGAISGTSASGNNVPAFLTAKLCKVN